MERARLEDLSLIYYIKNEVFLKGYIEERIKDVALAESPGVYQIQVPDGFLPSPFQRGRGLLYYDEIIVSGVGPIPDKSSEQSSRVTVFDAGGGVLPTTEYKVDYRRGRILTTTVTPATVSYFYNYVSVIDADEDVREGNKKLDLPFVVVESQGQGKADPLELGGGKITPRKVNILVYATNQAERDDLTQALMDRLEFRGLQVTDFNFTGGFVLNFDGTFNTGFSSIALSGVSKMQFENVSYRYRKGTRDFTLGERYRSVISLDVRVWVEGP
jgi:uncharacterized protein YaaQ